MADDMDSGQDKESGELPLNLVNYNFLVACIQHLVNSQAERGELSKTVKEGLQLFKN
jgi:hypothetical protein